MFLLRKLFSYVPVPVPHPSTLRKNSEIKYLLPACLSYYGGGGGGGGGGGEGGGGRILVENLLN